MQADEALERILKIAEDRLKYDPAFVPTPEDHLAADVTRQMMVSLSLGMVVRGRMVPKEY